jgi:hypothetical protein
LERVSSGSPSTAIGMLLYFNCTLERRRGEAAAAGRQLTAKDIDKAIVEGALLGVIHCNRKSREPRSVRKERMLPLPL